MTQTDVTINKSATSAQSPDNKTDIKELSLEETKYFLTSFAFRMDKSLFGLPLASPSKRIAALLIDLGLIALLSSAPAGVLALAIAIMLYRLGDKQRTQAGKKLRGAKRRAIMRFMAVLILFFVLLETLPSLLTSVGLENNEVVAEVEDSTLTLKESLVLAGYTLSTINIITASECNNVDCWKNELKPVVHNMAQVNANDMVDIKPNEMSEIFVEISEQTKLTLAEREQLTEFMLAQYQQELAVFQPKETAETGQVIPLLFDEDNVEENLSKQEKPNQPVYSIIELVKGIINDLGLGFGWATFYFTVFIALNRGQTIGKKIIGIKVLQLDGTPLSLWDSFGRYGGYGAGIATGLLGFIQIYWDPNRQAIHDKISATVVIDIKKARFPQQVSNSKQSN